MARRRQAEVRQGEDHGQVIDWYRDRLSEPSVLPWVGGEWEPVRIGPTWETAGGRWALPAASLGWDVLGWCGTQLQHRGKPWRFTLEQARFVLWWYAVDEDGGWLFRDGVLQRLKGHGKDPLGACLLYVEAFGPSRVLGMERDAPVAGECEAAWVQTAATSLEQTKNTMRLMPALMSKRAQAVYRVQMGKELIHGLDDERLIQAVTSSPATLEGARATFVLKNEALAVTTPVPTPDGWTTIGEVEPGDVLYGSERTASVVSVTDTYRGRPCFEVEFEDGDVLVADEGHLWQSRINGSGALPQVRTTRAMFEDGRSFAVPLRRPVDDGPDVDLPLDPYVLGYWLGDGDSASAIVSVGDLDLDAFTAEMGRRGVQATLCSRPPGKSAKVSLRIPGSRRNRNDPRPPGVRGRLAELGVLGKKHVPDAYLRGSIAQRLDLLRGLMDSDGCASATAAIFVNQNVHLAHAVRELALSLGYRVALYSTEDDRWSTPIAGHRVQFRADVDFNPFLLARKASKVSGRRRPWRSIVSIRPVPSVPVKCIEVDAADHLFVAGRGWALTHNTQHWLAANDGHEMAAVIDRNATKSEGGAARSLAITNAYEPGEDSVAQHDREAFELIQEGRSATTGFLYDSLEAPPDAPLSAEDAPAVVRAIRGDSVWLNEERILASILDTRNPPSTSRRFWYNQIHASEDAWLAPLEWGSCADVEKVIADRDLIVLGFDGSRKRAKGVTDATALIGCRVSDGHLFEVEVWEQPPGPGGDAWEVPAATVDAVMTHCFDRWQVVGLYCDPAKWEGWVSQWEARWHKRLKVKASASHPCEWWMTGGRQNHIVHALQQMHDAVLDQELTHDGSYTLTRHVLNARRRPSRAGIQIAKEHPDSARKIDAAVAAVLAWQARLDAVAAGVGRQAPAFVPRRVY